MRHSSPIAAAIHSQNRNHRKPDVIGLALLAIFVCQFAMLCYCNFTQLGNHMGYDSSWNFLRASLMWKEKALFSPSWSETTNFNIQPIAPLLFGLTGNLLLSFGIADTIMTVLNLLVMWKILERLQVGFNGRMIAFNLVICPYLTTGYSQFNDLGYFSNALTGAAYYSTRVLIVLLVIYEFLKITQDHKIGPLGWLLWIMCVLSGISNGIYLLIILLVPYLAYEIEMAMIRNDWKQLIQKESLFAVGCGACVLVGKFLALFVFRFTALDSNRSWTALEDLWTNFFAVFQGLMKLLQVLPIARTGEVDQVVMSTQGILRLFVLSVFVLLVIAVGAMLRQALKRKAENGGVLLLLTNIVVLNFLIFALFNVQYGTRLFEERYLITTFFVMALMTAMFYESIRGQQVCCVILSVAMAGSVLAVDAHSDLNYLQTTNEEWQTAEIQSLAESQNAGVVYFWGDDITVIGRTMRALDTNRIYKELPDNGKWFIHWGDYTTYDNQEEYTGSTMLVCPREKQLVPERVLEEYTLLKTLDQVEVYISDHNPKLF